LNYNCILPFEFSTLVFGSYFTVLVFSGPFILYLFGMFWHLPNLPSNLTLKEFDFLPGIAVANLNLHLVDSVVTEVFSL